MKIFVIKVFEEVKKPTSETYKVMLWIVTFILHVANLVESNDIDTLMPSSTVNSQIRKELFVEAHNEFTLHLYKHLASADDNIFFCAACLSSSMSMLMQASAKGTAAEFNRTLQYKKKKLNSTDVQKLFAELNERMEKTECLTQFTNTLYIQKDHEMKYDFVEDVANIYNIDVIETDFARNPQQAIWDINESTKAKTRGRIKRLFERLSSKISMLLVNTASFKPKFNGILNLDLSQKDIFYSHGVLDHDVDVYVMKETNSVQKIATSYDFRALELPCECGNDTTIKFWIFLPHKIGNLPEVEYALSTVTFKQIQDSFQYIVTNITIPRIRFDFSRDISKDLQKLEIKKAFQESADFSGLSEIQGLHLSQVLQRAIIELNGDEIEAAFPISDKSRDTNIVSNETNFASEFIPPFKINHPFLFSVIDSSSGLILYIGRVLEF